MTRFYYGAKPHFFRHTKERLFVSNNSLRNMKTLPEALGPWSEDSGGFTELQRHGRWTRTPKQYVQELRRHDEEIGNREWAAPQDWMCEDAIINGGTFKRQKFVGTGLSVREHQHRTVGNFLDLMAINDTLRIIPVVQGDRPAAYEYCIDLYDKAGINLLDYPTVGIGSVCRIQDTPEAVEIIEHAARILGPNRLHGFGFKIEGLEKVGYLLGGGDSFAWSENGKHKPGCDFRLSRDKPHKNEANCLRFMLEDWGPKVHRAIAASHTAPRQLSILDLPAPDLERAA